MGASSVQSIREWKSMDVAITGWNAVAVVVHYRFVEKFISCSCILLLFVRTFHWNCCWKRTRRSCHCRRCQTASEGTFIYIRSYKKRDNREILSTEWGKGRPGRPMHVWIEVDSSRMSWTNRFCMPPRFLYMWGEWNVKEQASRASTLAQKILTSKLFPACFVFCLMIFKHWSSFCFWCEASA